MSKQPALPWIDVAVSKIGIHEIRGQETNPDITKWLKELKAWWTDDETAWCGTFVAWCLKQADVAYPKMWMQALAYRDGGTKLTKPAYGCVAVKERKGGGHVCFVVGRDAKTGKLVCLGGNQSDQVCLALYNETDFVDFRWYGKTANPLALRYNLPEYSGVTAQKVTES